MYTKGAYGDVSRVAGTGVALAVAHTGDNHGPQSPAEIIEVFERLRRQFPGAKVEASSLNEFAEAIASRTDGLPLVTAEIGDTWIYGVASDCQKASRFRELTRLHRAWSGSDAGAPPTAAMNAFARNLLLVAEHTWGLDEKTHLADFETYAKDAFSAARTTGAFPKMEESWREQRAYLDRAVEALPTGGPREQALAALAAAAPAPPDVSGLAKATSRGRDARPDGHDGAPPERRRHRSVRHIGRHRARRPRPPLVRLLLPYVFRRTLPQILGPLRR